MFQNYELKNLLGQVPSSHSFSTYQQLSHSTFSDCCTLLQNPFSSTPSIFFLHTLGTSKLFLFAFLVCILCVNSVSILIIVFTEAFPYPPILICAHCSHLNFAMLKVTMLKEVHRQFLKILHMGHVQTIFGRNWPTLCKERSRNHCDQHC